MLNDQFPAINFIDLAWDVLDLVFFLWEGKRADAESFKIF